MGNTALQDHAAGLGHGIAGIAMNLEEDQVGVVIMGEYTEVKEGGEVKRTGKIMSVPTGEGMVGRVVNSLGLPIDDKGPITPDQYIPVERIAPGVIDRRTSPLASSWAQKRFRSSRGKIWPSPK